LLGSFARRIAGLGRLADSAPAAHPAERLDLQVLVVGGGPSGLAAAARLGARATLADDGPALGGALIALDPPRAVALSRAAQDAGARLLQRTSVLALSREPDDGTGRLTALLVGPERTLVARCQAVLLATGCHDAVPAFINNDLPGIFAARAALFAWRSDVLIGQRIALVGSGRFAQVLAQQMRGALGLVQLEPERVLRAIGRERISGVEVQGDEGKRRRIKVDALAFDGPGAPSFELAVQAGARVDFEPGAGYRPRADAAGQLAERLFLASASSSPAFGRLLSG
jgi:sarcosine oxidase subunit alpha